MLKVDIPNARLIDDNDDFSQIAGRGDYCKSLGFKIFSKEYRDCKNKLQAEDKARKEARKTGSSASTSGGDWVASDNTTNNTEDNRSSENLGQPSSDAKNNNPTSDKILGMEKPVAIPVIALSLLAVGTGLYFLIKKVSQ